MDAPDSPSIDAKPKLVDGKIVWSGGPSLKQHFSLPYSIMYYMAKNPSSAEAYNKLIQCCKYFFEKNPILVAADLFCETTLCSNPQCDGDNEERCCANIDLNKLSSKIWLTNNLSLAEDNISIFASLIVPKLYRWKSVKFFLIQNGLMYNDFKSYAALLTDIDFYVTRIIDDDDGSVVMLDKILEATINIKFFE
uniref:Uncharacterized protein n=1 Tax=Panagrolaimus sp. ES5 TaxID=591445 RepID=A0AC34FGM9_9BILA